MITDLGSILIKTIRRTRREAWSAGCKYMSYKQIPAARTELRRLGFKVDRVIIIRE